MNETTLKIIGFVTALVLIVVVSLGQLTHWTFNFNDLGDAKGVAQKYSEKDGCTGCGCD